VAHPPGEARPRHRPLRPGDALRWDRGRHARVPREGAL